MPEGDVPVLLTWADDGDMLELRPDDSSTTLTPVFGALADFAREVMGLAPEVRVGARQFECHPDDLRLLDSAARRFTDESGFTRAFAHDRDHKMMVNARYREVGTPTSVAFDPASVAMLALQVQAQMSLERIELVLEGLGSSLDALIRAHRIELEAEVLSSVEMVEEVWASLRTSGTLSQTDWDRIAPLEHILRSRHRRVIGELDSVVKEFRFSTVKEARASVRNTPTSVRNLMTMETYLRRALTRHLHLSLVLRQMRGEATQGPADQAARLLQKYGSEADMQYKALRGIQSNIKEINILKMLMTKGIPAGRKDNRNIRDAIQNLTEVQKQSEIQNTLRHALENKYVVALEPTAAH